MKLFKYRKLEFGFIHIVESLVAIMLFIAVLMGSYFFKIPKSLAEENEDKYVLKILEYAIDGDYGIMSAYDNNLCFDVKGGLELDNNIPIIAYPNHNASNQKFTFYSIPTTYEYIYWIAPTYTSNYVLDMCGGSSEEGTKMQLYSNNNTNAQRFVIREVYERIGSEEKYIGYMILTAVSNYKMALSIDEDNNIVQTSIDLNNINMKQVWFLNKGFSGYCYSTSGYRDIDKVQGKYNAINYELGNDMGGFYYNTDYWSKYEDFLTVNQTSTWKPQNARITQYGYTLFDSAQLDISINNALEEVYAQFLWVQYRIEIGNDESSLVNGKYIDGVVGQGCVEVEYTDSNNKTFSMFTNNVFANASTKLNYKTKSGNYTFDEVGTYTIRVYYKVKAEYITYAMKEFSFSIASTTTRCDALMSSDDSGTEYQDKDKNRVLSSYSLSVVDGKIQIAFDGNEEYRAKDEELLDYITNSYYLSDEEKQENIDKLIEEINSYNEYKIYFTNTAFFMSTGENDFTQILTIETGYDKAISTVVSRRTKTFVSDGIYEFVSSNKYVFGVKNYYRVLLQSEPNKQVFRNVTYCYSDEDGKLINYAIDYAFLEDLKIFPYTMTLSITYENITNESANCEPIDYTSNTIIYNTTDEVLKLKFVIKDISGNQTILYLSIFPTLPPTLNQNNLKNSSYEYNYISNGYAIKLFDEQKKDYVNYLFSTKEIALQNFLTNIIESRDICKRFGDGYELNYNPDGTSKLKYIFDSNQELIEYLYELFENNVYETALSYDEAQVSQIPEKAMHFDTLYLNKDFYFTTDRNFPLFESYKVYFNYYNSDGKLLKDGIITYNGEFKYGESMFHILASDVEENWCDGYVKFVEYNISSNTGTEYVAYIINANSKITIREHQGTKFEKRQYSDAAELSCEEFSIANAPNEGVTYVIEYENEKIIYNSYTYKDTKFNKSGNYKISIENTHGFRYEINIEVYSLAAFIEGVENFGTTENNVIFTSDDLDFKYYINGKLQNNDTYDLIDGKYVFTFTKSIEDKNIYIVKNFMQFACLIKGEQEFDVSPYYSVETVYASPNAVKEYRRSIQNNIDTINNHILNVKNYINDFATEPYFNSKDIQNNKYNELYTINKENYSLLEKEQTYLNNLLTSRNVLLTQNKNYEDVYVLQELLEEYQNKVDSYNASLVNYAYQYFEKKGICFPKNKLEDISLYDENQILEMYSQYLKIAQSLDEKEMLILDLKKQLNDIINSNETYREEINFITNHYSSIDLFEQLLDFTNKLNDNKKSLNTTILTLKRQLEKITFDGLANVFVDDDIERISASKQEGLDLVTEASNIDFSPTETLLRQKILYATRAINLSYLNHIKNTEKSLDENVETLSILQDEREWWKIFSNIKRDKKINETKENIQELYNEYRDYVNSNESIIRNIKNSLTTALNKNPNVIETSLISMLDETLEKLTNLSEKISREVV